MCLIPTTALWQGSHRISEERETWKIAVFYKDLSIFAYFPLSVLHKESMYSILCATVTDNFDVSAVEGDFCRTQIWRWLNVAVKADNCHFIHVLASTLFYSDISLAFSTHLTPRPGPLWSPYLADMTHLTLANIYWVLNPALHASHHLVLIAALRDKCVGVLMSETGSWDNVSEQLPE